jgi:ankyrin repeat protein
VGQFLAVQQLLMLGADPARITNYNSTPLHYAAAEGYANICQVLLENTVVDESVVHIFNRQDRGGLTAMDYAILHGHTEVQKVLTEYQWAGGEVRLKSCQNGTQTFSE